MSHYFDVRRFGHDVERALRATPNGIGHLCTTAGVHRSTLSHVRRGLAVNVESTLAVMSALGLHFTDYTLDAMPAQPQPSLERIDWALFAECARNLCAGDPDELARLSGVTYEDAIGAMVGGSCSMASFYQLCKAMRLRPEQLEHGWHTPRRARHHVHELERKAA
jgi:hypothetical protein